MVVAARVSRARSGRRRRRGRSAARGRGRPGPRARGRRSRSRRARPFARRGRGSPAPRGSSPGRPRKLDDDPARPAAAAARVAEALERVLGPGRHRAIMIPVLKDVLPSPRALPPPRRPSPSRSRAARQGERGATSRDDVVAALYPLAWAAEQVAERVSSTTSSTSRRRAPSRTTSSCRRATSSDRPATQSSSSTRRRFQPAVEDAVAARDGRSLDVLAGGERDPHVWLDPVRFAVVARGDRRGSRAPARAHWRDPRRLEHLDREYRRGLERLRPARARHEPRRLRACSPPATASPQLSLAGARPRRSRAPRELERLVEDVRGVGRDDGLRRAARLGPARADRRARGGPGGRGARPDRGAERGAGSTRARTTSRSCATNLDALREALGCR